MLLRSPPLKKLDASTLSDKVVKLLRESQFEVITNEKGEIVGIIFRKIKDKTNDKTV